MEENKGNKPILKEIKISNEEKKAISNNILIIPEKCKRCGLCSRNCPVGAISGDRENGYKIDTEKCIKCGACSANCHFGAI